MAQTWEQRDKKKRHQSQKDWYWRNREEQIEKTRAWQRAHPEQMKLHRERRQEKIANNPALRMQINRQAREKRAKKRAEELEARGWVPTILSPKEKIALTREFKVYRTCTKCGESCTRENQAIFVWHHRESGEKKFPLSKAGGHSIEEIIEEIRKCDLVCFNCHALIHNGTT